MASTTTDTNTNTQTLLEAAAPKALSNETKSLQISTQDHCAAEETTAEETRVRDECCICYNIFHASDPVLACACRAKVHPKCMRIWNKSCPLCRQVVQIIPKTRCILLHTEIYDGIDIFLKPLQNKCILWRNMKPDKRTSELIDEIWILTYSLANFIWQNRVVMRRNDRLIINIKKRLPKILETVIGVKKEDWVDLEQNKKDIKQLKYILERI